MTRLWAVHSEKQGMPAFRTWAKTKAEAQAKLAALEARDADQRDDEYWITELTDTQIRSFTAMGLIPAGVA